MSKEKVDAYKARKANRKQEIARENRNKKMAKIGGWAAGIICAAALVFALGLTGVNSWKAHQAAAPNYDVTSQIVQDYTGVTTMDDAE